MRHFIVILFMIALSFCMAGNVPADMESIPDQQQLIVDADSPFLSNTSLKVLGEFYRNSSDFKRQSVGAEYEVWLNGIANLMAGYTFSYFSQSGFEDINRHKFFIQGETQVSQKIGITARISESVYDNDNENFNGGVFLRYRPQLNLFSEISYRHFDIIDYVLPFNNAIYSYVVTIGSIDRNIQSDDYKIFLLYYPAASISFAGEVIYGDYSDGNEKRSLMFEAGYKFRDNPHLRTAYNYFYLDLKNPAPLTQSGQPNESAYWDPVNFDTHTLRLEFRDDYLEHLTVGAEGALSYSFDSEDISSTVFLYASYRVREYTSLRFDARWFNQDRGVDRRGKTDGFWAENYSMILQHRF